MWNVTKRGIKSACFPQLYDRVSRVTLHLPLTEESCNFHTNKVSVFALIQNR